MSRIGKMPIPVPAGVEGHIDGQTVTVKGPKGELTRTFLPSMTITCDGDELIVTRPDDTRESKSAHGLTRTLLANMVEGGRTPYLTAQELQDLGYRLVVFPVSTLYAAMQSVLDILGELKATGTVDLSSGKMVNFTQFNDLIGLPQERRLEENDFSVLPR